MLAIARPVVAFGGHVQYSPSCGGPPEYRYALLYLALVILTTVCTIWMWMRFDCRGGRDVACRLALYVVVGWSWVAAVASTVTTGVLLVGLAERGAHVVKGQVDIAYVVALVVVAVLAIGSAKLLSSSVVEELHERMLGPGPSTERIAFFVLHALHTVVLPLIALLAVSQIALRACPPDWYKF